MSRRKVQRLIAAHAIGYRKVGRLIRFTQADLDAYVEACRISARLAFGLLGELVGLPLTSDEATVSEGLGPDAAGPAQDERDDRQPDVWAQWA